MSTIEKAAAKLVVKPAPPPADPNADDAPADTAASQNFQDAASASDQSAGELTREQSNFETHSYGERQCQLDFEWLGSNGFLVPGNKEHLNGQQFRRIKRQLLLNGQNLGKQESFEQPSNVIFVTSARPGEGKTFVALNLSLSLAAEIDRSVLLVDGDPAKGDLSRWLGIYGQMGFIDLLESNNPIARRACIESNVPRLSVMPCGNMSPNLDELYASNLMSEFVSNLSREDPSRVIVFDGPPLLATTEAAVLARRIGQVVMVVEANKTPQAQVLEAAKQLRSVPSVSMLLNKTSKSDLGEYGYGYGYGYGYDDREQETI